MRRIAVVNQKGGVGKTTTVVNLGAALARRGQRVVVIDLDPQANMTVHLGVEPDTGGPSTYSLLCDGKALADVLVPVPSVHGLWLAPANIDLSGAELELASELGREAILRDAVDEWARAREAAGEPAADVVLFDCPPSLGLLSLNALVAAREVFVALQTEFFALQGMSRLLDVLRRVRRRLNPGLELTGIVPCLYDNRLRLAREVLGEIRQHFPDETFRRAVTTNVKLAEAPSYGLTIFDYAPESRGAFDYAGLADEVLRREAARQAGDGVSAPNSEDNGLLTPAPRPDSPQVDEAADAAAG